MPHITPGYNGWTDNAPQILRAINARKNKEAEEIKARESLLIRYFAELQYYEDNNGYPRQTGYCGTETDAHFYER